MTFWQKEKKVDLAGKILLFLIFPVLSFLYSFNRPNTKSSYLVFFLMGACFGLSFTVASGKDSDGSGLDSQWYRELFERYSTFNYYEFSDSLNKYLSLETGKKDFFIDIIAFYTSRFTENYHIFFLIISIIFSYFCLKSFRFFTSHPNYKNSFYTLVLVYFFNINQLFNINGARFWIAAWIATYCILQIHVNSNKRYYLLALILPFIHGSYSLFLVVLLFAALFKKFDRIWIVLFYISIVVSSLATTLLIYVSDRLSSYLPKFISDFVNQYTTDNLATTWTGFGWLPELFGMLTFIYYNLLVFILIRHSKVIKSNPKTKSLYLFLLVWISIFNFISSIPSAGRYLVLGYPLLAYIWLANIQNIKYNKILLFAPLVYFWQIYNVFNSFNRVLDPLFYISSPFYLIYKYILQF